MQTRFFLTLAYAAALSAVPSLALADPVSLTALAATAAGSAVTSALTTAGLSAALAPVWGAAAEVFLRGATPALNPQPKAKEPVTFFAIGPSLILPAGPEPGAPLVDPMLATSPALARRHLDDLARRDVKRVRAALPHGPLDAVAAWGCHGHCLGDRVTEWDVLFYANEMVLPGDVALFLVRGESWAIKRVKVFLGTVGPRELTRHFFGDAPGPFALFAQFDPEMVLIIPWCDLAALVPATHRVRDGKSEALSANRQRAEWLGGLRELMSEIDATGVSCEPLPAGLVAAWRQCHAVT